MENYDVLIVGGGAAGISAAKALRERKVLLAERKDRLGGILLQCFHRGFGKEMNGPEYVESILSDFPENINTVPDTTVLDISENTATLANSKKGIYKVKFRELILATGCMERAIGHMDIAGTRPEGVYTAGLMQEMMNIHGIVPKGPAVVLGSGDIGLIMATHLLEKGIDTTVIEINNSLGGLLRNQKWMYEYPVKVRLSVTIKEIIGEKHLEGVLLTDDSFIPCRTLLTATGLIPDRELIRLLPESKNIHICGNANTVHPMIEAVIKEGYSAGLAAYENTR